MAAEAGEQTEGEGRDSGRRQESSRSARAAQGCAQGGETRVEGKGAL